MIGALTIGGALFVAVLSFHYAVLAAVVPRARARGTIGFVCFCALLLALHLIEVGAFAAAYEIGRSIGIGDFKKPAEADFMDIYYFSMATFTTLGLGKVMPTGHLASIAGLESFTGFLCISMSASAFFQWIQKEI